MPKFLERLLWCSPERSGRCQQCDERCGLKRRHRSNIGLIVLAMIYSLGDVSGCHLNPAVTLGFFVARRLEGRWLLPYIIAQCLGALGASFALRMLFPNDQTLGMTMPSGLALQSFVLEVILTFFLMFVILSVSTGSKEKGVMAGVAVGSVIALEALFAGPISGASMNPARSLAPAVVALQFKDLWVYLTAPFPARSWRLWLVDVCRKKDAAAHHAK